MFKEEIMQFSTISSRKYKQKEHFLTHSVSPALPKYQNQTKPLQERKTTANISHGYSHQNSQQNIINLNPTVYKKNYL